jgi:hypothetical protein
VNHVLAAQQLRDKRAELEKQLIAAMKPLLDAFHADTGLSPSQVDVRLCKVWPCGHEHAHHVLELVRVTLDL